MTTWSLIIVMYHILTMWSSDDLAIVYWTSNLVVVKPTKDILISYLKKPVDNFKISMLSIIPVFLCIFSFLWCDTFLT